MSSRRCAQCVAARVNLERRIKLYFAVYEIMILLLVYTQQWARDAIITFCSISSPQRIRQDTTHDERYQGSGAEAYPIVRRLSFLNRYVTSAWRRREVAPSPSRTVSVRFHIECCILQRVEWITEIVRRIDTRNRHRVRITEDHGEEEDYNRVKKMFTGPECAVLRAQHYRNPARSWRAHRSDTGDWIGCSRACRACP